MVQRAIEKDIRVTVLISFTIVHPIVAPLRGMHGRQHKCPADTKHCAGCPGLSV